MFNFKQYNWKRFDFVLVIVVILLCICSAILVRRAGESPNMGESYFKKQLLGLILGVGILAFLTILDYHFVCRFVVIFYVIGVILVAATKFSPIGTDLETDSYRWLDFGFVNFQPSEIAKIILILTLAVFYTKFREKIDHLYVHFLAALIMIGLTFFVFVQSDLSSSMVLAFIFAMVLFSSGIKYKILIPGVSIVLIVILSLFWYIQQPYQKLLEGYQLKRVNGFLHPEKEALDTMYQQNNSIKAIASGKVYGKMLLEDTSSSREYRYVGVNESDFIFSIVGEELGFIGSCFVLGLLGIVIIRCLLTARKAKDFTGQLIAVGVASMFMFQVFANVGVATSILPNTGLPLPFLSYGLSSMMGSMIGIGLILNIGIYNATTRYDSMGIK